MKRPALAILIFASAFSLLLWAYLQYGKSGKVRELPYFKPVQVQLGDEVDKQGRHIVSDFSLLDQTGKKITRADFSSSIVVVNFFFTTCKGICPRMNSQLDRVYEKYKGNSEVKFISHTVNPDNESVPVMAAYAQRYHPDANQWHFVTGDKKQLYDLARRSYMISDTRGDGGKEDFVHSQNFALVDKEGHVRGIYDGLDSAEVDRLMTEMDVLLDSYKK